MLSGDSKGCFVLVVSEQRDVIAIKNGKFFICNTGSNEKRWDAMKDKLKVVVNSFTLVPALSGAVGATIPTF